MKEISTLKTKSWQIYLFRSLASGFYYQHSDPSGQNRGWFIYANPQINFDEVFKIKMGPIF